MKGEARREKIRGLLEKKEIPTTGGELASILGVSRQVIVQDVALLRAEGQEIMATPQGYLLAGKEAGPLYQRTYAVSHTADELEQELNLIVDCGGRVVDVTVEHPLYGELKGFLMLASRQEVQNFLARLGDTGAAPLSLLTSGVHLHTVEALSVEVLDRIQQGLAELGYLVE